MDFAKYRDKDIVKLIGIKGMVYHKSDIDKLIFYKDADNMDKAREGIMTKTEYQKLKK